MHKPPRAILTALFFISCLLGARSEGPQQVSIDELNRFIETEMKRYHVPGVAVAIVQDGKVVLAKGYGVRDFGKPEPVDENTLFQLASVSKSFTAVLLGTYVDDKKLGWDVPIINYLPEFVDFDPYITRFMTTRDLLAHRTGWPAFTGDLMDGLGYSRPEILRRVRYLKPAVSFREITTYSNIGYFTAGEVATKVGGAPWNDLMMNRVVKPLGMSRTGTKFENLSVPNVSGWHGLSGDKTITVKPAFHDSLGAAGSMCSSATDMARYLQMFLGGGMVDGKQIIKPETIAQLLAPSAVADVTFAELPPISENTGFNFGMGVGSFDYAGKRIIEKGGALAGVRTTIILIPELRAGIVVMANLNLTALPEAIRAYWIDRLLGIDPAPNQKATFERNEMLKKLLAPKDPPKNPQPFAYPLSALVGVYENDLYGKFELLLKEGGLVVSAGPAKMPATMVHVDGGLFYLLWPSATAGASETWFTIGADGKADSFTNEDIGVFKRVLRS